MWKNPNLFLSIALAVSWWLVAPATFLLLYTTIEMQIASRAATGNAALATHTIRQKAAELRHLSDIERMLAQLDRARDSAWTASKDARRELTRSANGLLLRFSLEEAKTDSEAIIRTCGSGADDQCLTFVAEALARSKKSDDSALVAEVEKIRIATAAEQALEDASLRADDQYFLLRCRRDELDSAVRGRDFDYSAQLGGQSCAQRLGIASNAKEDVVSQPEDGSNIASDQKPSRADAILATALSYNDLRRFWFFELVFYWPTGAVVAFFTALMGAMGAVAESVVSGGRASGEATTDQRSASLWRLYVIVPITGIVCGFAVYFVIAAGAAFLVQSGTSDATLAVNQLSPPALATLGLFAGLAANQALKWLIKKANSFFGIPDEKDTEGKTAGN